MPCFPRRSRQQRRPTTPRGGRGRGRGAGSSRLNFSECAPSPRLLYIMTHQRLRFGSRFAENGHTFLPARKCISAARNKNRTCCFLSHIVCVCVCRSVCLLVGLSVGRLSGSVCLSGSVWVCLGLSGSVWVCLGLSGSVSPVRVVHVCAQRPHPFRPLRLTSHSSPLAPKRCWRHG